MTLTPALKRLSRIALRLAALALALCVAIVIGFAVYALSMLPPLQPWHTEILKKEFSSRRDGNLDFDGYLKLENELFAEMRSKMESWDKTNEAFIYSRFNPASRVNRLVDGTPYNRSFRLPQANPMGHALLIHGLTDSPYSMKALAESLHARGLEVTVLRVPGHGTLPSMMTEMTTRDWTAAVRIAARDCRVARAAESAFLYRRLFDRRDPGPRVHARRAAGLSAAQTRPGSAHLTGD